MKAKWLCIPVMALFLPSCEKKDAPGGDVRSIAEKGARPAPTKIVDTPESAPASATAPASPDAAPASSAGAAPSSTAGSPQDAGNLVGAAGGSAKRTPRSFVPSSGNPPARNDGETTDPTRAPIPTAQAVPGKPGFVFSPHSQKIIDVRDITSGTLVQDPTFPVAERKYFRAP